MNYGSLISDPRQVCDDWFYRFMFRIRGHPAIWAGLFAVVFPFLSDLFKDVGEPISHVRSVSDLRSAYFFGPVILTQVLVMPLLYRAALECLDELRRAMVSSEAEFAADRRTLLEPTRSFQWRLIIVTLLVSIVQQEILESRFTRFISGNWNVLDLWLTFMAFTTLMMFSWFLVMPISRTLVLARLIDKSVEPKLFDDQLGSPIGLYGLRAGLVFGIPYALVNSAAAAALAEAWLYILPGFIGFGTAVAFAIIPGERLRRKTRRIKRAELSRVKTAIDRCRSDLGDGSIDSEEIGGLVKLLDYRREVKAMREWPFEAKIVRGFGLYFLLIPLTWVASALVEMVIEKIAMS